MNRTTDSVTLVCYDISSNRLRRKISLCMKDFGTRKQFSMFILRFDAGEVSRCRSKLKDILETYADEREDSDSLIIIERFNPKHLDCLLGEPVDEKVSGFEII